MFEGKQNDDFLIKRVVFRFLVEPTDQNLEGEPTVVLTLTQKTKSKKKKKSKIDPSKPGYYKRGVRHDYSQPVIHVEGKYSYNVLQKDGVSMPDGSSEELLFVGYS